MNVQTNGTALRGMPPPSSEILIVISSFPLKPIASVSEESSEEEKQGRTLRR